MSEQISEQTRTLLRRYQRTELTDHIVYSKMAAREKDPENKKILQRIALDEKEHARVFQRYTGVQVKPNWLHILWYTFLGYLMGYTFVIKLMEKGEYKAGDAYDKLAGEVPGIDTIIRQEQGHEDKLAAMLDEERLKYVGDMVLGLNDALVELTGTIAGLTFALANTRLIALSGIITGVSATLSMAASNFLAKRAEENPNALKSSLYTGVAYLITVVFLVLPYLLFPNHLYWAALITMLAVVILIILFFNYYIAVAKDENFGRRFGEMLGISLGVAVVSFVIGLLVKHFLGIDI
ncbi:VIT1/CCC1 transporter family protein [Ruminococcaceae bacterium OttesenSCG-928-I18]|nr:VIT1/CCC1 transporter family protein [Ruminococcaceae bacterium OttesenSCG-928-I18]